MTPIVEQRLNLRHEFKDLRLGQIAEPFLLRLVLSVFEEVHPMHQLRAVCFRDAQNLAQRKQGQLGRKALDHIDDRTFGLHVVQQLIDFAINLFAKLSHIVWPEPSHMLHAQWRMMRPV